MAAVLLAQTDSFGALVRTAKLDPARDLQNACEFRSILITDSV
jgi:hypothetical protein